MTDYTTRLGAETGVGEAPAAKGGDKGKGKEVAPEAKGMEESKEDVPPSGGGVGGFGVGSSWAGPSKASSSYSIP